MNAKKAGICLGCVGLLALTAALLGCGATSSAMNPVQTGSSRFLYVVNAIDRTVSGFSISAVTGALTSVGAAVPAGDGAIYLAASPNGKFLYVANAELDSSNVSAYRIDATTGVLTPTTPATFTTKNDSQPLGIAVDPTSTHVYTANVGSISAFIVDPASGALADVPGTPVFSAPGAEPEDLTVTPDGRFLYATNIITNDVSGYTFDANGLPVSTGASVPAGNSPQGIVVDPSSKFVYVANQISDDISGYAITPGTGALVPTGPATFIETGCGPQELAVDPSSKFLFVTCFGTSSIAQFTIDPSTGRLAAVLPVLSTGDATQPRGIAVDASGRFVYSALNITKRAQTAAIGDAGSLTLIPGAPATGKGPIGVAISGSR